MENKAIANLLYETADLLEIDGADSFRIRSYRNAAQAIENHSHRIADLIAEPKKVLEISGIGKGMLTNLQEILNTGKLTIQTELLAKYHPSMLQLLKIQGLGPKTIALIWSAYKVSDVDGVEKLAREGKIRTLPRLGEKHEQKLLKAIEDYRRISGRFLIDTAETEAEKLIAYLKTFPGIEKITPAGSLRRGRETVGDLDILVTGKICADDEKREAAIEHVVKYPPLMDVIARGDNKVSFRVRNGMQVDVRLLPPESFGAAMQYFTGSKAHNVALRQRALKMGYTLSEYSLADLKTEEPVAGKTEEEIYAKLNLDYIPPEMRENLGEIDLAAQHTLPNLVSDKDISGDVHMRTGAMLQVARVPETLKVREHVDLFSSYYPKPLSIHETLEAAGLTAIQNRKFGELSGGQKQRLLFALAICGDPDLLFLDEATLGLDVEARRLLWEQIRHLASRGKAVLLTTHYLQEADALADRILVINRGEIIAEGTPSEIKARTSGRQIRCQTDLTLDQVRAISGVVEAKAEGNTLVMQTKVAEPVLRELLRRDPYLSGTEVTSAGLEEAFLALTSNDQANGSN